MPFFGFYSEYELGRFGPTDAARSKHAETSDGILWHTHSVKSQMQASGLAVVLQRTCARVATITKRLGMSYDSMRPRSIFPKCAARYAGRHYDHRKRIAAAIMVNCLFDFRAQQGPCGQLRELREFMSKLFQGTISTHCPASNAFAARRCSSACRTHMSDSGCSFVFLSPCALTM